MIPVLKKFAPAWPKTPDAAPKHAAQYLAPFEAFTREWADDMHFAAYSVPSIARRLDKGATKHVEGGVPMVLLVFDVDHPAAHAGEKIASGAMRVWHAEEIEKVKALDAWMREAASKPKTDAPPAAQGDGLFQYTTNHGYRIVTACNRTILNVASAEEWRHDYWLACGWLFQRFGIVADPACADWTRIYRLPHVVRDNRKTKPVTFGDPVAIGALPPLPARDELRGAVRKLAAKGDPWAGVEKRLFPEPTPKPPKPPKQTKTEASASAASRYVGKALDKAAAAVREAPKGERHATLSKQAYGLAGYIDSGAIDAATIRDTLAEAAAHYEDQAKTLGSLDSAIAAGRAARRELPALRMDGPAGDAATDTGSAYRAAHVSSAADDDKWRDQLVTLPTSDGEKVVKCIANLVTIATHDPRCPVRLGYDERAEAIVHRQPPRWHQHDAGDRTATVWTDADTTRLSAWFSRFYYWALPSPMVAEAANVVARKHSFDPIKAYFQSIRWDGVVRLDKWLTTYCGAEETPYTRGVGVRWLISAVARTWQPGCKVDCILVLEGAQGIGKSSALDRLAGGEGFFSDDELAIGDKDAAQSLRGPLIFELGELSAMSKGNLHSLKAFVTRRIDHYRPSYGRVAMDFPRRCVFAASTNDDVYLKDSTGGRRWWPVKLGSVNLEAITRDRDQLWAEAVVRYEQGEAWHADTAEFRALCAVEAEERYVADPWEEAIGAWCVDTLQDIAKGVTSADVLTKALKIEPGKQTRADEMRVGATLSRLGWTKGKQRRVGGARVRLYQPPPEVVTVVPGPVGESGPISDRHNSHNFFLTHTGKGMPS